MTNFISCYQGIWDDTNIATETQRTSNAYEKFRSIKSKIVNIVQRTNLKYLVCSEDIQKAEVEVSGIYETFFQFGYQLFCKIQFKCFTNQILILSIPLKNSIPFRIMSRNHRLLVNKFILKVNSSLNYGSFRLNQNTGELSLTFSNILTQSQLCQMLEKTNNFSEFLQEQFLKGKYYLRLHLFKVLYLINELPQSFGEDPELINIKTKRISVQYKKVEQLIKKITPIMHMEYPYMFSDLIYTGTKRLTIEQAKKMNDAIKVSKCLRRHVNPQIYRVLKSYVSYKSLNSAIEQFRQEEKKQFIAVLLQPLVKYQNGEIPFIYSQIEIVQNPTHWQMIDFGGFGYIYKGLIKFKFINNQQKKAKEGEEKNEQIFTKYIVKKQDFDPEAKKLHHQKLILSKLKNISSPFIAKFYYSEQANYKNSLFIQYCSQKSLTFLKYRTMQFMTLYTKLLYLKFIAQGLKLLKDQQICHLDIKPSNILFSGGLIKITDFGEAYHPQVCPKNFRPGTSLPFAPPQSFSSNFINFNNKLDIYSFGILMYELIFEANPFDYNKNKSEILKRAYTQRKYMKLVYLTPQKVSKQGFSGIYQLLKLICLKCLQQDQRKRPCVEWIIILLQCCLNLQSQLY